MFMYNMHVLRKADSWQQQSTRKYIVIKAMIANCQRPTKTVNIGLLRLSTAANCTPCLTRVS